MELQLGAGQKEALQQDSPGRDARGPSLCWATSARRQGALTAVQGTQETGEYSPDGRYGGGGEGRWGWGRLR